MLERIPQDPPENPPSFVNISFNQYSKDVRRKNAGPYLVSMIDIVQKWSHTLSTLSCPCDLFWPIEHYKV